VKRFYDNDCIKEAETKGVLTPEEARDLAELRDMVARVIAVDDFAAWELKRDLASAQDSGDTPSRSEQRHIAAE
jgi:acyl-CoA dehydrogenase